LDSVGDGESSIALYTSEPSVPQRLNVRSLLPAQRSTVKAMCTRVKTLKITRLTAINLYNSSLGQRLERQVVAARPAQRSTVNAMCARIKALKITRLTAINLYNSTLSRRLAPLQCRAHLMSQNRGISDPTRLNSTEVEEVEYTKELSKITTTAFTSLDEEFDYNGIGDRWNS
jgi:methylthioribose-1-phosphate isomerase